METRLELGHPIPALSYIATNQQQGQLADFIGQNLVIYFYPKDHTPGCTHESKDFRDHFAQFQQAHTQILGVSADNLRSHERFKKKWNLPFELIADTKRPLCNAFGVMNPKVLFGKSVFGIVRSTFLFDQHGILRQVWRKVKTAGHAEAVLKAVQDLPNTPQNQ